jgi:hypothetical protein
MKRILRNRGFVIAFAVLASVSLASAATITQTETFSGIPNFSNDLTFDEFDDLGGTLILNWVRVQLNLNISGGEFTLDNDGVGPASGNYEFGANGAITSTDVALLDSAFQPVVATVPTLSQGVFSLAGDDGDGLGVYDGTAPDGVVVSGGSYSNSDLGFIASSLLSQYMGNGTFDITADLTQWTDFGGVSGIEWAVTPVSADGSVVVTYDYSVPEPATMSLLAVGGVAALIRRRRK